MTSSHILVCENRENVKIFVKANGIDALKKLVGFAISKPSEIEYSDEIIGLKVNIKTFTHFDKLQKKGVPYSDTLENMVSRYSRFFIFC